MNLTNCITILSGVLLLSACGSSSNDKSEPITTQNPVSTVTPEEQQELSNVNIKLNQLGFLPNADKVAIIPNVESTTFELVSSETDSVVFEGNLSGASSWELAGEAKTKQADFSGFNTQGTYFIRVSGVNDSSTFEISNHVYSSLHDAALKFYYFNRASQEITEPYGEQWIRAAGHLDQQVKVHASAATEQRPPLTVISSPKGWYDAGDYGKYVVNSGISTYTLLAAYEHFPTFYQDRNITIPESNDAIPDILNETLWNLEWLETMQDLDGGVYHKLTTLNWPGLEMPDEDQRDRYVIGKTTAASLNLAAVLAMASRVYEPFESSLPNKREAWLTSAKAAWNWAVENPNEYYQQPEDVSSGEYGDIVLNDEFAWAAAELFITTKDVEYLKQFQKYRNGQSVPSWASVSYLALSTLLMKGEDIIDPIEFQSLKTDQLSLADNLVEQYKDNSYRVSLVTSDFVWGSNAAALNKALILMQANQLTDESKYRDGAINILDYILGRNPTDYSFVTGFGDKTPMNPHHRVSESDNNIEPVPGMLVGGPHAGQQDKCIYVFLEAARSYLDDWCSFSTNEVTINWNAPLVYVLAALNETD